ncbi:MAG: 4Fe-4S binding protein [Limnochordaceae bacterium]|nr:4Fe-4S binding protein [Limnochordaceae bacterium]
MAFCPQEVLRLASGRFNALGYPPAEVLHPEACTGCGHCARMCPEAAITVTITRLARAGAV